LHIHKFYEAGVPICNWTAVIWRSNDIQLIINNTCWLIKSPPPVGAGGGYMFSGRPSVLPCVRSSVRPSVIHMVVLCFRDISSICWRIFAKPLSLVHLGTQWPDYVFGSKGQRSRSHHRGGGAQHSMLPSSATFSSFSVVHHCLMASSTVVASCRWCMNSKTCSRLLTATYNIN